MALDQAADAQAWYDLLRQPAAGVWGTVPLVVQYRLVGHFEEHPGQPSFLKPNPALERWIRTRASGIGGLEIHFFGGLGDRSRQGQRAFFESYLGYLQDLPFDLSFKCKPPLRSDSKFACNSQQASH
ncbi:hypothetical protein WJX73_004467 [Symbiochloris irregularis]|uniref:Uncharacterized protein n=1 Tax=Symbiochloris irregularis TaxID=706552 RepID=A0AAW1PVW2_9CHLO